MRYEIGGLRTFKTPQTATVLTITSKDPVRLELEGTRAFARRKDGQYVEIFRAVGEHSTCTWDTKAQALKAARAAHHWLSK